MHGLYAQSAAPPDVLKAANDGFTTFLMSAVTEDTKTIIGFSANDDLSAAVLGTPFKLYVLPDDSVINYNGKAALHSIVVESDMWYFPIMINDTVKMMLYVGTKGGAWRRAGLGSAGLARELQCLMTQYSPEKGYTPLLVQQRNTGSYFFNIPQVDAYNLTEAFSGPAHADPRRYAALKELKTTITELQKRKGTLQCPGW